VIDVRCMSDIRGLPLARRAGHHVLLIGPPGSGKTMLAFRFPGLLPPLDETTADEARRIHHLVFREERPIEIPPVSRPAPHGQRAGSCWLMVA
jgi:magnesium chelatase family protein